MKICIVGLGLIGGSLAKAIKKNTHESCFGIDIDRGTTVSYTHLTLPTNSLV